MTIRVAILTAILCFLGAAPAWPASAQDALDVLKQALALHEAGKVKEAIEQYDRAIQTDPRSAKAYFNRGKAYTELADDAGRAQHAYFDRAHL